MYSTLKRYAYTFACDLKGSFIDLSIVVGIVAIFQLAVLRSVPQEWPTMLIGLIIVAVGLALFLRGLEIGVFPLGEDLSTRLAKLPHHFWIILFAFIIGFATTIAEPALIAIAHKAAFISDGTINTFVLRLIVALSVGIAIVLGVVRIIFNHPIWWYIITGYIITLIVTYFAPPEIVGLAYDSGGVTTSTVTVPILAALGIGLAATLKNRNPLIDGFGLIAFASLLPMIFVQLYGIAAYSLDFAASAPAETFEMIQHAGAQSVVWQYVMQFLTSIADVLPVILTILFFYFVVLRRKIENFSKRAAGFLLVILGLYAFVIGLELGLFPIGETLATELTLTGNLALIYLFAFCIGFATTIAEPSLTAIARKAQEVSDGAIRSKILRLFVALGVGLGILLGTYRIIQGDPIVWYIMAGYIAVIIMTYFAPRTIIAIAYDSGGVTTSCVTVPIVAALGLGLATNIPGRDPLIDGFGLIAFASLFPMIAVLGYGIVKRKYVQLYEQKIMQMESKTMSNVLEKLGNDVDDIISKEQHRQNIKRKHIITITGDSGSGVSSATKDIAEKLDYRKFSSSELFRKIAEKRGESVEELNKIAEKNTVIDSELDELLQELGEKNDLVIDSRLGYHWIRNSFKVYLTTSPETGAKRIHKDITKNKRVAENTQSLEETEHSIRKRSASRNKRFHKLYGIDVTNLDNFDLVIDTEKHSTKKVAEMIVEAYKGWVTK